MLQGASVESHVPMYEHRKVVFFYQNYPLYSDFIYYLMLFELFFVILKFSCVTLEWLFCVLVLVCVFVYLCISMALTWKTPF